jgi:hypothetical protein
MAPIVDTKPIFTSPLIALEQIEDILETRLTISMAAGIITEFHRDNPSGIRGQTPRSPLFACDDLRAEKR